MFESEQPADTEQCPPHTLALGLDHADFLVPFIPRHLILLGQEKDLFDARGLEQSHARLERLYTLLHRVSRATHRKGVLQADLSFLTGSASA